MLGLGGAALLLGCVADPVDGDGDGYASEVDCDDTDATVFPGSHSPEIPFDGIDQDCDGLDRCTDLGCDGWPDLVLARTQDEMGSYQVDSQLWRGSATGLELSQELPVGGALGAAIEDLDSDGYLEVIIARATSDGDERHVDSLVFWGSPDGVDESQPLGLPTIGAADVTATDIDGDGHVDLCFPDRYGGGDISEESYTQPSRIYWGSAEGPDPSVLTELTTLGAARCAVADLDGDGRRDLAFAAGTVWATSSPLFRASGARSFEEWTELPTAFAEGVTAGDADGDGWTDLVFSNWCGGGACDSILYLGGAQGYSPDRAVSFGTDGAVDARIADLDGDGQAELVFAHSFGEGWSVGTDSVVWWGPEWTSHTGLWTLGASAVLAGDLDLDGLPELVFPGYYGSEDQAAATAIYAGSAEGFDADQVDWIEVAGAGAAALSPRGRVDPPSASSTRAASVDQ